ncbi:MAG: putative metal-binding motif-containing protein [Candidatus Pacearchaeota archaeon]|jgi:hypothetical protein
MVKIKKKMMKKNIFLLTLLFLGLSIILTINISTASAITCTNGQTQLCSNQQGVCAGSLDTCTNGIWPGCTNYTYSISSFFYEIPEYSCSDGLDNDCNGLTDMSDPSCNNNGVPGDCCSASGGMGCTDQTCQNTVCAIDSFCCTISWDTTCASEAATMCSVCTNTTINNTTCTDTDLDGFSIEGGTCGIIDCNDNNANINPNAIEICDGIDNDCNGQIDEGGVCSAICTNGQTQLCSNQQGVCAGSVDTCTNGIWPGCTDYTYSVWSNYNYEVPEFSCNDGLDNNCNGLVDCADNSCSSDPACVQQPTCTDDDNDGFSIEGGDCGLVDCNDNNANINPNALDNNCNGVDDNCNGQIDEGYITTSTTCGIGGCASNGQLDCVNGVITNTCTPSISQPEMCDGIDNDCNGVIDNGVLLTFYRDLDLDLFGNNAISQQACTASPGYVADNTDCNDNNANIKPNAIEVCNNGVDDNCNGLVDCADSACATNPVCQPAPTTEDCLVKSTEYTCNSKFSIAKVWTCNKGQGTHSSCNFGQCSSKVSITGWTFCPKGCNTLTGLCNNGSIIPPTPTVVCNQSSDCGVNGFNNVLSCKNNSVFQNYVTYTCKNPGTSSSYCTNSVSQLLNKTCATNETCSNGVCLVQSGDKEDCSAKPTEYTCESKYSVAKVWTCNNGQGTLNSCNFGQCSSKVSITGWAFCPKGCNSVTGLCK